MRHLISKMPALHSAAALSLCMLSAAAVGAESTDASSGAVLEEIVVRAQRIEQNLQKVPVAVQAVTSADLDSRKLHELTQITTAVPSLEITTDNAFTLRGVGSQIFTSNVDASVGTMVDDVSLGVPLFMGGGAFIDIAQIEVLTGPQGLLFGRNTSAGLINIITQKPLLGQFSGDAYVEYDDRDRADGGHFGLITNATLNVPVSENSALRLNIGNSVQDPITGAKVVTSDDLEARQKRLTAKVKYLWVPSDDLNFYLIADYNRERGIGGIFDATLRVGAPAGHLLPATLADGCTPGTSNLCYGDSGPFYRNLNTGGVSLRIEKRLTQTLTLSDILAWRNYTLNQNIESDATTQPFLDVNALDTRYNQYSNELRLAYSGNPIDGQVGLYTFWSNNHGENHFDGTSGTGIPHFLFGVAKYETTGRSVAGYGQLNFHLTDAFQLLAGARITHDHIGVSSVADNYDQTLVPFPFGPNGPPALPIPLVNVFGPLNQDFRQSAGHTNFSYKFGAQYDVTPDIMFYLNFGTGYKGPAFATNQSFVGQDVYIRPEIVHDLEGGVKAMLFDRRLRLNLSAFIERFTDWQAQSFTPDGIAYLGNAEGVKSTGVEIEASYKPVSRVTINYDGTVADAHFTRFTTDACYFGQSAASCPNGVFFDGTGQQLPTNAHYRGTLQGMVDIMQWDGSKLTLEGNWYHRTPINYSSSAAPYTQAPSADIFGASLTWDFQEKLTAAIFCKNCANRLTPTFISADPGEAALGNLATLQRWGYNSVRTVGASVNYKF